MDGLEDYLVSQSKVTYRRKRSKTNVLVATNALSNYKLLNTLRSSKNLRRARGKLLHTKRPIIKVAMQRLVTPLNLLYERRNASRTNTYTFTRKNFSPFKVNRGILRKMVSKKRMSRQLHKKTYRKPLKFANRAFIPSKTSFHRPSDKLVSKIKIKNASYSFTLKNSPLYISYRFRLNLDKFVPFKSTLKKLIFSFLKANQIKRSLMLRRQKITYFRFFNRFNKKDMSNKFLTSNYNRVYKSGTFTTTGSTFDKSSRLKYHSYVKPFFSSLNRNTFLQKFPTNAGFNREVFLPRVRFKPGYQRLWRQSRRTLAESLRVRYIYQQQFTKYIGSFGRRLNNYHFSRDEYFVSTIALHSRLISDYNTLVLLSNSSCVFVNGHTHTNLNHILFAGDVIQLLVSNWMYTYLKWVLLWTSNRVKKFRRLVYRKNLAGSYRVMKTRKQRSNYTPLWIYHTKYDISDIKPFLETDFFTMSSMLIYDHFMFDFHTPSWFIENRQTIYRLYNWKYIT